MTLAGLPQLASLADPPDDVTLAHLAKACVFGRLGTGREGVSEGVSNFGNLRLPTAAPQRSYPLDAAQWRPVTLYGNQGRETYKQEVPGSSPGPPITARRSTAPFACGVRPMAASRSLRGV
jgi:hypothetical protein